MLYEIIQSYNLRREKPGFKGISGYQKSFQLAMEIFEVTKSFPADEQYSLTSQIRRSSRLVCTNLADAYREKLYTKNFVKKVSDSDGENNITRAGLDFAYSCRYIDGPTHSRLSSECVGIGELLSHMILHPEKYGCGKPGKQ